ncbi:MAG: hypothetical protein ACKOB2_01900 [Solirubrobacterales bacterium]
MIARNLVAGVALISVYRSPAWPIEGGAGNARPVYERSENLEQFTTGSD